VLRTQKEGRKANIKRRGHYYSTVVPKQLPSKRKRNQSKKNYEKGKAIKGQRSKYTSINMKFINRLFECAAIYP
jgi:hypothetical protein